MMRLDKFLVAANHCTRSQAKQLIRKGRVSVNGEKVCLPQTHISENTDSVMVDEKVIIYHEFEYYMLNKPAGTVSATTDNTAKTVISFIDSSNRDLFPVGRLDKDTEGLLLITNDGALAHRLLSPGKHVNKKYYATIKGEVTADTIKAFQEGLKITEDFTALPAELEVIKSGDISEVFVTLREGKFHQIKRMFQAVGMKVLYLKRISMKNLVLDEHLAPGQYRKLTDAEKNDLFQA